MHVPIKYHLLGDIYIYIYIYIYTHACTHIHRHTHTYTHAHTYIYNLIRHRKGEIYYLLSVQQANGAVVGPEHSIRSHPRATKGLCHGGVLGAVSHRSAIDLTQEERSLQTGSQHGHDEANIGTGLVQGLHAASGVLDIQVESI